MGPRLLIIGAMKAGTSSLYEDLRAMRGFAFPIGKEPDNLLTDDVLTQAGREAYANAYADLPRDVVGVDASAQYTLRPHFGDVASRAREVLGPDLRLVYVMRHPIARAISHHHFDAAMGWGSLDFDAELERNPYFIDGGRYAYQLEPWLDAFGTDQLLPITFEHYIRKRGEVARRIADFANADPTPEQAPPRAPAHQTSGIRRQRPLAQRLARLPAYRRIVRPLVPEKLRQAAHRATSDAAPPRPSPPSQASIDRMVEAFEPDQRRLAELLGPAAPSWDLASLS
ncbi:MAG: sulfotransferase domain-containing protein [Phycisphaerales bacterium]